MNILNNKSIYKLLKKINITKTRKELCDELIRGILELVNAQACWICLINPVNSKIEIRKFHYAEGLDKDAKLRAEVSNIQILSADLMTNNFDAEDTLDYFNSISKDNKIIEPIIYRNSLLGYIGIIAKGKAFNKEFTDEIGIIMENANSKLEIISLNEEKEKTLNERVEFLASISHEFKTPLNSIIGFSDVLKDKSEGTEVYKYIDNISKSSVFLLSLIQDVLDLARSQSRPLELRLDVFRPKDIISDIIWGFEETRKEKNIQFSYTLTDIALTADLRRFKQLIYNLISNAVKFSKYNSTITIVTYINENKEFVFEIKDSGDGISKKDYGKIFNFFSQVNRNQLKRQQGSGVGLALCQTIVQAHGGEINFKSRLNHGSTFWFTIPKLG